MQLGSGADGIQTYVFLTPESTLCPLHHSDSIIQFLKFLKYHGLEKAKNKKGGLIPQS